MTMELKFGNSHHDAVDKKMCKGKQGGEDK